MLPILLSLALAQTPAEQASKATPAVQAKADSLPPLSFFSKRYRYFWDKTVLLEDVVDGLKLNSIFFNRREVKSGLFKGADFGLRAQIEVTNTAKEVRTPGFCVAVFDTQDQLLGVASGGTKFGTVKPGETETFDLTFTQVLERLPKGAYFVLAVELRD